MVILNEKEKNLNEAEEYLSLMMEKFGEDYNIYKRYAFLELDKQELKSNKERNYQTFSQYYRGAVNLYYDQLTDNNTDAEMQLLENLYQQVVAGGGSHNGNYTRLDFDVFRCGWDIDMSRSFDLFRKII